MDFELKPLSIKAIPEALEKVERYRLLNEPKEAESICLDILNAEPGNQKALIWLILSLTDQFNEGITDGVDRARELLPQLKNDYDTFYDGVKGTLNINHNFLFEIRDLDNGLISDFSVEKLIPSGREVRAKEIPIRIFNENAGFYEFKLKVRIC